MDNLYFNKDDFNKFEKLEFSYNNAEANIYLYNDLFIKIYKDYWPVEMENKLFKLDELGNKGNIGGLLIPEYKVYIDGVFRGCASKYIKSAKTFSKITKSNPNFIDLYKNASKIMNNAHKKDIVLSDVSSKNILFKNQKVFYCDLDSCTIGNLSCEVLNPMIFYNRNFYQDLSFSKKTDIFLLNMLFLNTVTNKNLTDFSYERFAEIIKSIGFDKNTCDYFLNIYDLDDRYYLHNIVSEESIKRIK